MNESENKKRLGGHRLLKLNCRQFVYSRVRFILEHTAISPNAEFLKMHKRYAELGSYIGANCPHVVIENKLKMN